LVLAGFVGLCAIALGHPGLSVAPLSDISANHDKLEILNEMNPRNSIPEPCTETLHSEPLSEIPVDLLFLHLIVPPTVKRLTISGWMRARLEEWWKYTARQLRLSSFMFGKLYADELQRESSGLRPVEGPTEGWTLPDEAQMYGRWLRVPKGDNIAFLRDAPVLIQVNHAGQAVKERGREVMEEQDQETRRAGRQPDQDYTIVHVPPYFGMRCMLLVMLLWITAASVVVTGTAGPIILGRWLLARTMGKMYVHDGYALVIGWYVLWGSWRLERAVRAGAVSVSSAAAWCAQVAWLALGLGIITPALLAIAVEVYIVLPLRLWWNPELVPVIRVVEEWALGLVFMKIGWQTWRLRVRARNAAGGGAAAVVPEPNANAPVGEREGGEEEEAEDADQRLEDLGRAMEQVSWRSFDLGRIFRRSAPAVVAWHACWIWCGPEMGLARSSFYVLDLKADRPALRGGLDG
jgi:hypothetical protein